MYLRVLFLLTFSMILSVQFVQAEMRPLDEQELTGVTGEGVGLVFEDFQYNAANSDFGGDLTFKLTGIEDQSNNPVDVSLSHFYIAGPNSAYGTALDGNVVNLGRLGNPFTIDMLDGNDLAIGTNGWTDKAVLSIAAPTHVDGGVGYDCTSATATEGSGTCSSRPEEGAYHGERMDIGMRLNLDYVDTSKNMNLNLHAQSAHFDGSYLRLWGGDIDVDGNGSDDSTMMMEAQVNFYADKLYIDSCNTDGSGCGNGIEFSQFKLELALGDAEFYQPMTFDVNADGNFTLEIHELPGLPGTDASSPVDSTQGHAFQGQIADDGLRDSVGTDPKTWDWYNDYYSNGRKTNFRVEDMTVGGTNFGNSYITNLQIQHLKVTSHDL
jgi:hypothetical protein